MTEDIDKALAGPIEVEEVEDEDVIFRGAPLNADRIDAIVSRARREGNLQPGGKSLSGGQTHSPAVRIVLPEDTKNELEARAKSRGQSVSKYVRELIQHDLAS